MLRERRGPAVGRLVAEVYGDVPGVVRYVRRALRGEAFVATVRVEGQTFECAYAPERDATGRVSRVVGVALDVTAREHVERELAGAERDLREARHALTAPYGPVSTEGGQRRVTVVADRPLVRFGLVALLNRTGGVQATEAYTLDDALAQVRCGVPPEAVVLSVPDPSEAVLRLRSERPSLPVLVVDRRDLRAVGPGLLRLGAAGVVAQADAPDHLAAAVRAVLRGIGYVPPAVARALVRRAADSGGLSDRERQAVTLVAQGLSRAEVAARMAVAPATVTTYRRRALQKLGLATTGDLVRHAVREGWVTLEP